MYYEPRRTSEDLSSAGGRQSYFATAFLDDIQPDLTEKTISTPSSATTWSSTSRYRSETATTTTRARSERLTARPTKGVSVVPSGS